MRKLLAIVMVMLSLTLLLTAADAEGAAKKGKKGKHDPEATFKKLDTNGDGKLSKDEFLKLADRVKDAAKAEKVRAHLTKTYDKTVANGSGMTLEQFKEVRTHARKKGNKGNDAAPKKTA